MDLDEDSMAGCLMVMLIALIGGVALLTDVTRKLEQPTWYVVAAITYGVVTVVVVLFWLSTVPTHSHNRDLGGEFARVLLWPVVLVVKILTQLCNILMGR